MDEIINEIEFDFVKTDVNCKAESWESFAKRNNLPYEIHVEVEDSAKHTTCDICGKVIVGVENFINAGDMVVCSEECKQKAIGKFFVENSLTSEERNGMLISYKDRLKAGKD